MSRFLKQQGSKVMGSDCIMGHFKHFQLCPMIPHCFNERGVHGSLDFIGFDIGHYTLHKYIKFSFSGAKLKTLKFIKKIIMGGSRGMIIIYAYFSF